MGGQRRYSCRGRYRDRRRGRGLRVVGRAEVADAVGDPRALPKRSSRCEPPVGLSRTIDVETIVPETCVPVCRIVRLVCGWQSRRADRAVRSFAAFAWSGRTRSARPAKVHASSVTPADGKPAETKKARLRRCFKPRPSKRPASSPVVRPRTVRPQARANLSSAVGRAKTGFHNQEQFDPRA